MQIHSQLRQRNQSPRWSLTSIILNAQISVAVIKGLVSPKCWCEDRDSDECDHTISAQAVTGYFQNVRKFKNDEGKFKSIMYGTGLNRAQTAFNLCKDFSKNGNSALILN